MDSSETLRSALKSLPAGAAWPAGKAPSPEEIFTPSRHRNVLDIGRSLVVGNRGVGKTFWSHALSSTQGRAVAASAYDFPKLKQVSAVFGFRGALADSVAPSSTVFGLALERADDPLIVWQSILLRASDSKFVQGLPNDLPELSAWFSKNPERGEQLIRAADEARANAEQPLLLLFDALDTLANDWAEIRRRTVGLLRVALLAKGLRATHLKIFMRPDQFADTSLFQFPDASKLRAERVELQWAFTDLYALMFFHLWKGAESREQLKAIQSGLSPLFVGDGGTFRPAMIRLETVQRQLFESLAGPWMGRDKKRGATYSWLVQHLADARGETTPRGFLTALRTAAESEPANTSLTIDYRGIQHGVAEASENRVDDLRQDYWWIDDVKAPLAGLETPLERERLFDVWRGAKTAENIRRTAKSKGLLPVYLALRQSIDHLPADTATTISSDEAALLQSLRLINVVEIRPNGKVNVPDIFRVAFKMKRRGGVPPKRAAQE